MARIMGNPGCVSLSGARAVSIEVPQAESALAECRLIRASPDQFNPRGRMIAVVLGFNTA
jgi:hypothetical protein